MQPGASAEKDSLKESKKTSRILKNIRKYHKWPALFISLFLLLFALSGIVLNHRNLFAPVDVARKWLPGEYRYDSWNLASVKSFLPVAEDSILIYGNIGIWLTDKNFEAFVDFSSGFPEGIDKKKIFTMLKSESGEIYAGALSGLYLYDKRASRWKSLNLPAGEERITGMAQRGDSILVLTRSNLLFSKDSKNPVFEIIKLPPAEDDKGEVTLFRTLWLIHSGKIYGLAGKIIVDLMGLVLIYLVFSGLFYFFTPGLLKRVSAIKSRSKLKRTNRYFIQWHNTIGYITALFLVIIVLTGMFLRPPLLIPIAGTSVPVIKNSWLDNPNPWFDNLRDIIWDKEKNIFIFSTSKGMYYSDPQLSGKLLRFPVQPPVSVMGINVFKKHGPREYLVGSFSGIFRWMPEKGFVIDHLTGKRIVHKNGPSNPFGNIAIAGRLEYRGSEILLDYTRGVIFIGNNSVEFPVMPENIIAGSPMSLWNLALEVHTGRYLFPLIGNFYILYIPLMGISTLIILITGLLMWWRKRKKRRNLPLQSG